ncbi:MAG: hypothetical protein ABMA13_02255 [Chthoniobacteraceae bacterium]
MHPHALRVEASKRRSVEASKRRSVVDLFARSVLAERFNLSRRARSGAGERASSLAGIASRRAVEASRGGEEFVLRREADSMSAEALSSRREAGSAGGGKPSLLPETASARNEAGFTRGEAASGVGEAASLRSEASSLASSPYRMDLCDNRPFFGVIRKVADWGASGSQRPCGRLNFKRQTPNSKRQTPETEGGSRWAKPFSLMFGVWRLAFGVEPAAGAVDPRRSPGPRRRNFRDEPSFDA